MVPLNSCNAFRMSGSRREKNLIAAFCVYPPGKNIQVLSGMFALLNDNTVCCYRTEESELFFAGF